MKLINWLEQALCDGAKTRMGYSNAACVGITGTVAECRATLAAVLKLMYSEVRDPVEIGEWIDVVLSYRVDVIGPDKVIYYWRDGAG